MTEVREGCRECPFCHHITLPKIAEDSCANATCCSHCFAVVNKDGQIETCLHGSVKS